jgi:hypothetical protein
MTHPQFPARGSCARRSAFYKAQGRKYVNEKRKDEDLGLGGADSLFGWVSDFGLPQIFSGKSTLILQEATSYSGSTEGNRADMCSRNHQKFHFWRELRVT